MNYLVYLAYGGVDYCNEALYALLSYYQYHTQEEATVIIYTDNPAFFKPQLPKTVVYIPLTGQTLHDWKGKSGFNHRIKIKVLQDACVRFPGNILYCDTDTHFNQNVTHLFDLISGGGVVFHQAEGSLAVRKGNVARKLRIFLKKHPQFILAESGDLINIDSTLLVWNAGVIGFSASYSYMLQNVLELTDAFCEKANIFVLEQVAFNYFFQRLSVPYAAEAEVEHYWYFKEFRVVLSHFFSHFKQASLSERIASIEKIAPYRLSEEKRAYKAMGFWEKQWTKVTKGAKWRVKSYEL